MKRGRRNLLVLAAAGLFLSRPAFAQRQGVPEPSPPPGGPFSRIFYGDFTSPRTESIELRGKETLADLARDGKIPLTPEDAVRLALEHNVDINVERYGPYLSMWDVEKARGVLNATLNFSADLNRTVTPSSSTLQGGTSVLNLQNLYNFLWHKPLSLGMDLDLGGDTILRDYSQGFIEAPIIGRTQGGFQDALSQLFSMKYVGYALGFAFRMPIGNDEARANNARAQIQYRQGDERLRSLRQTVALEVRQAYDAMQASRARVQTGQVTVRYNQQKLEGEQEKYRLGANTTYFVLQAQRDLLEAQTRLLRANLDLVKSRIAVDKAVGDTFAVNSIQMADALPAFK